MKKELTPPIRYFGGKSNMKQEIFKYFPEKGSFTTYIEPFSGSYSMGLTYCADVPNEIYNDLNKNVYSLYKVLQDKNMFNKFKEKCDLAIYCEDFRNECKKALKSDDLDMVSRAFMFYYVNRTSHNGLGGVSLNLVVRRNMSKSVSDMLSSIDRMYELHQRLSKVIVLNRDAFDLIEKYMYNEDVFMYLDPPYVWDTRTSTRYDVDMTNDQHQKLIDICMNSKCKMLISGYDHELYDKLVNAGWTKVKFDVNTVSGNMTPKTKTETLWMNYEPKSSVEKDEKDLNMGLNMEKTNEPSLF